MYQFTTSYPLADSKTYLDYQEQLIPVLEEVILLTNAVRRLHKLGPIPNEAIHEGVRMIKFSLDKNPRLRRVFGKERFPSGDKLDHILFEEIGSKERRAVTRQSKCFHLWEEDILPSGVVTFCTKCAVKK